MSRQHGMQFDSEGLLVVFVVRRVQVEQHIDIGERHRLVIVPDRIAYETRRHSAIRKGQIAYGSEHVLLPLGGKGVANHRRHRFRGLAAEHGHIAQPLAPFAGASINGKVLPARSSDATSS